MVAPTPYPRSAEGRVFQGFSQPSKGGDPTSGGDEKPPSCEVHLRPPLPGATGPFLPAD